MQEAGTPDYTDAAAHGVLPPVKMPRPIFEKLNHEIVAILQAPDVAPRLAADGTEPVGSECTEFDRHIRPEIAKWKKVVAEAGIAG
jgi:tripartite-type tricarboxylate transporter receptor subunit TctC